MRVYDVFCAVSLSGTMRSAESVLLDKTAVGGNASFQPAERKQDTDQPPRNVPRCAPSATTASLSTAAPQAPQ